MAHLNKIVHHLWQWHFGEYQPAQSWSPQVNLYQMEDRLEVCVDLAGVDRQRIHVEVKTGRLLIRGVRQAPEPEHQPDETMRIVAMEIDHGPFCRAVNLPSDVALDHVESDYREGFLWIHLPLRKRSRAGG